MVIFDVVLMALISAAIVGFLVWSICTQHRHYDCSDLRIRRRLKTSVKLVEPDHSELAGESRIAAGI
jgi:hypothetical protein